MNQTHGKCGALYQADEARVRFFEAGASSCCDEREVAGEGEEQVATDVLEEGKLRWLVEMVQTCSINVICCVQWA